METWKYAGGTIDREESIGPRGGVSVRWIAHRKDGKDLICETLTEAHRFLRHRNGAQASDGGMR
jgi:hypothetical protein